MLKCSKSKVEALQQSVKFIEKEETGLNTVNRENTEPDKKKIDRNMLCCEAVTITHKTRQKKRLFICHWKQKIDITKVFCLIWSFFNIFYGRV